jgi:hypothetical protein
VATTTNIDKDSSLDSSIEYPLASPDSGHGTFKEDTWNETIDLESTLRVGDVRRFDVFVVILLLASDIDDVRLLLESVLVLFRFDKRDAIEFFRLLVSVLDAALKLSFFFELLAVPRI